MNHHLKAGLVGIGLTAAIGAGIVLTPHQPTILPTVSGVTNPDITQATIGQTICNPNWSTKSIRPTSSYTTALKIKQLKALGWNDQNTADFEEDHLISLELGGAPSDPNNLWPESYKTVPNAKDKDKIENYLHAQVCAGNITLQEAQREISTDWTKVHTKQTFGSVDNSVDTDDL